MGHDGCTITVIKFRLLRGLKMDKFLARSKNKELQQIAYITMQMPIEENKDFSEFYELVYWKMILNKIKVIDNEEEVRISNSLLEWLKKETPEFRKKCSFQIWIGLGEGQGFPVLWKLGFQIVSHKLLHLIESLNLVL